MAQSPISSAERPPGGSALARSCLIIRMIMQAYPPRLVNLKEGLLSRQSEQSEPKGSTRSGPSRQGRHFENRGTATAQFVALEGGPKPARRLGRRPPSRQISRVGI